MKAISHANPLRHCPQPHLFFIPQPSHPLSTPFAPTIPLSLHRPTLNRLLWNLFKYFDISPPLTSRAEMICDSWRWARSRSFLQPPAYPPPHPPSFFVERPIFLFWLPSFFFPPCSFIHRCSSCQLEKALKAPRGSFFFFFFVWLHSVMDKLGDIPLFVDILCLLSLFFVPFAQCPPSVWSCADTVYGSSEGNPATAFMWILWGYGATKWLLLLFFRGL